jgi:hypothetical protein
LLLPRYDILRPMVNNQSTVTPTDTSSSTICIYDKGICIQQFAIDFRLLAMTTTHSVFLLLQPAKDGP